MTEKQKVAIYACCVVLQSTITYISSKKALTAHDEDRWITLGGGEKDTGERSGRHVKIDEHGNIVGGAVPKSAQGKNIKSWWKKGGSESKPRKSSVFGDKKPLTVETYYRESRGYNRGYYGDDILEASETNTPGEIEVGYPTKKDWQGKTSKTNRTNYVNITISAGFHDGEPYNLNFDNIKRVTGKTFDIKNILKENGFKWDRDSKSWVKMGE